MAEWDDRVEGLTRDHGRIVSVSTRTLGSPLTVDATAEATSLTVFDVGHFDAKYGGTLGLNGVRLAYATCDDDADIITLTDPLPAAALDGDFVACWDTLYDAPVTVKTAMVQLDGDDDNPDPIECYIPHFLADKISEGDRGGPGESVVIEYDEEDDEWRVAGVRGLAAASGAGVKFCNTDTHTVTATGDQTIKLSYTPIDGSLDVTWKPGGLGGVPMDASEWSVSGSTLTVPDPGYFAASDKLDPQYSYRDGPITPTIAASGISMHGAYSHDGGPVPSIALPAGTQVGDLIVLVFAANSQTVTDSRLTSQGTWVWTGVADTLVDLAASNTSTTAAYSIATFAPMNILGTQSVSGTSSVATPVFASAQGAIVAAAVNTNFSTVQVTVPNGYTQATNSGEGGISTNICYWQSVNPPESSPSGTVSGGITGIWVTGMKVGW